jgi:hypothetical protein
LLLPVAQGPQTVWRRPDLDALVASAVVGGCRYDLLMRSRLLDDGVLRQLDAQVKAFTTIADSVTGRLNHLDQLGAQVKAFADVPGQLASAFADLTKAVDAQMLSVASSVGIG